MYEAEYKEAYNKIQFSMENMNKNISIKCIRPLQKQTYLCISNCYPSQVNSSSNTSSPTNTNNINTNKLNPFQSFDQIIKNTNPSLNSSNSSNSWNSSTNSNYNSNSNDFNENEFISDQQINSCIDKCSMKSKYIQNYITNEMKNYQNKFQRCTQVCQDEANDKASSLITKNKSNNVEIEIGLLNCTKGCVEKHINMLPNLEMKIINEVTRER